MKNLITTLLALVLSAAIPAGAQELVRYELDVRDFTELKVIEGLNVDYRCNPDSAGKAVFTTTADLASILMFTNDKGRLSLQISTDGIEYTGLPHITVYSQFLQKAENSGDSTLRIMSVAPAPAFQATLIGNGRLVVHNLSSPAATLSFKTGNGVLAADGDVENLKITFSGTGTVQADALKAKNVKIRAAGTGAIGCWATETLGIVGAGSTSVYYKGEPQITNRSLGFKVLPLD